MQFLINHGCGCWSSHKDFRDGTAILIDVVHILVGGWEKEFAWLVARLFYLEQARDASFTFVWGHVPSQIDTLRAVSLLFNTPSAAVQMCARTGRVPARG